MSKIKCIVLFTLSFLVVVNSAFAYTTPGVSNTVGTTNSSNITTGISHDDGVSLNTISTTIPPTNDQEEQTNISPLAIAGIVTILAIIGYVFYKSRKR